MRESLPPTNSLPALRQTSRQFERWRAMRRRGERIPVALWDAAVHAARGHGVSKTSQTLHLDYYALQRRLDAVAAEQPNTVVPQFVELALPAVTTSSSQCRLELCDRDGGTVRLDLSGWSARELATFVRSITSGVPCSP